MAQSLISFIQTNKHDIQELLEIIKPVENENKQGKLNGEIVVLTGTMQESRENIANMLESMGATVVSSVSKKVTMVAYGDNPGSKLEAAKKNGIKIIDEQSLMNLIQKQL